MSHSKPQVTVVKSGLDASNNRLFNLIATAISEKLKKDAGVDVQMVGRVVAADKVTATLVGASDQETPAKVEEVMRSLKNPSFLLDLLR